MPLPAAEIADLIKFQALLRSDRNELPAEPNALKTTLTPLIAPPIALPAIETADLILFQAPDKIVRRLPPAPPNPANSHMTVPTQPATTVKAGAIA